MNDNIIPTNISQATEEIVGIWEEEISNGNYDYVPCLRGGRGCGKTYAFELMAKTMAEKKGLKFIGKCSFPKKGEFGYQIITASTLSAMDMGLPDIEKINITKDREQKIVEFAFSLLLPIGGSGMLFFDEVGQGGDDAQKFITQIIEARYFNGYVFPKEWLVCMATNRTKDRASSRAMISPLEDRISSMYDLEVDHASWINDFAIPNGVHSDILSLVQLMPNVLDTFDATPIGNKSCSPRTVTKWSNLYKLNFIQGLDDNTMRRKCIETVGKIFAEEFMSFRNLIKNAPDHNLILNDPDNAPLIEAHDSDVRYAVTSLLIRLVSKDASHFDNAVKYLSRFEVPEYVVFASKIMVQQNPDLMHTKSYTKIVNDNVL